MLAKLLRTELLLAGRLSPRLAAGLRLSRLLRARHLWRALLRPRLLRPRLLWALLLRAGHLRPPRGLLRCLRSGHLRSRRLQTLLSGPRQILLLRPTPHRWLCLLRLLKCRRLRLGWHR